MCFAVCVGIKQHTTLWCLHRGSAGVRGYICPLGEARPAFQLAYTITQHTTCHCTCNWVLPSQQTHISISITYTQPPLSTCVQHPTTTPCASGTQKCLTKPALHNLPAEFTTHHALFAHRRRCPQALPTCFEHHTSHPTSTWYFIVAAHYTHGSKQQTLY
jgi:hypothetical protein